MTTGGKSELIYIIQTISKTVAAAAGVCSCALKYGLAVNIYIYIYSYSGII